MTNRRHWSGILLQSRFYHSFIEWAQGRPRLGPVLLWVIPLVWVFGLNLAPLLNMLRISFTKQFPVRAGESPVYTTSHYELFFRDPTFYLPYVRTLAFASFITILTFIVMLPVAFFIAKKASARWQLRLLILVIIPAWTSELVRVFAIVIILGRRGAINSALLNLGILDQPVSLLYNWFSVTVGVFSTLALFMLIPLYAAVEKVPQQLLDAGADLGANARQRFTRIMLPLIRDGIATGATLVFLLAAGMYTVPLFLSGPGNSLFSQVILAWFYESNLMWSRGAAFAVLLFVPALVITGILNYVIRPRRKATA
jgi:spermidine/putrescine transport system permease protein